MTQTATPPFPPTPVRSRLPTWAKLLIGFALAATLGVVLLCSGVIYLGLRAPATRALTGSQLPKRHLETIRRLELLDEGERIRYFYSDGWLSIEDGMYFFTDRKVVVYGSDFEPGQLATIERPG